MTLSHTRSHSKKRGGRCNMLSSHFLLVIMTRFFSSFISSTTAAMKSNHLQHDNMQEMKNTKRQQHNNNNYEFEWPPRRRQQQHLLQQRNLQSICSCSPRSFTVTLDFFNNCLDDTLTSNGGIADTDCTIEVGDPTAFMGEGGASSSAEEEKATATLAGSLEDILEDYVTSMETKQQNDNGEVVMEVLDEEKLKTPLVVATTTEADKHQNRHLQGGGPASPTRITSVNLIEIDAEGNVINVDDQYNNVNFQSGSSFDFESISSDLNTNIPIEDQLELIPSTQILFMVGENARGEEVRGRFVWRYTNSCGNNAVGVQQGDEISWSVFTQVEDQLGEFCPANENGNPPSRPTPRPANVTPEPTEPPIFVDTEIPSFTPTEMPVVDEGPQPAGTPLPTEISTDSPTTEFINALEPTAIPTNFDGGGGSPPSFMSMPLMPSTSSIDIDNILDSFGSSSSRSKNKQQSRSRKRWSKSSRGWGKSSKGWRSSKGSKRDKSGKTSRNGKYWYFITSNSSSSSKSSTSKDWKGHGAGKSKSGKKNSKTSKK